MTFFNHFRGTKISIAAITIMFGSLFASCDQSSSPQNSVAGDAQAADLEKSESKNNNLVEFKQLLKDFEEFEMKENPITAGFYGDQDAKSKLPFMALDDHQRRKKATSSYLDRLRDLDISSFSETDQLNAEIFSWMLENRVALMTHDEDRIPGSSIYSVFSDMVRLAQNTVILNLDDAKAWYNRLSELPRYNQEQIENMRRGIETQWTHPDFVVDIMIEQIDQLAAAELDLDHPLLVPLKNMTGNASEQQKKEIIGNILTLIDRQINPSLNNAKSFLTKEYRPAQRSKDGIADLPNAKDYYRDRVRYYTTLDLDPEEIHQIGLSEVERIRKLMDKVIAESGFKGSFKQFQDFLKTDPRFYASSAKELLDANAAFAKRVDGQMPLFFKTLPRAPYTIKEMPAAIAPSSTTAYYQSGNYKEGRAGTYVVNSYALDQRPLYEIPALTLHEAVPGHHHQGMLANEQENVPPFRNRLYIIAFGEGWALYAEGLGYEMGLYDTPYDQFGQLSYEMWRACRLVADTGLHAKGWSREDAQKCFEENTALSQTNIEAEVKRYASWPGQALGYKIGQLHIAKLRHKAQKLLKDDFDVREFHDQVLINGSLPLSILERRISNWIDKERKR